MAPTAVSSAAHRPTPLACNTCRRKHLKCEGTSPCSRCAAEAIHCIYTASRRGLARGGKRSNLSARSASSAPRSPMMASPISTRMDDFARGRPSLPTVIPQQVGNTAVQDLAPRATSWTMCPTDKERLTGLFYGHFFGAHPFIVPKTFYGSQSHPGYLDLVVCFVGQKYSSSLSDEAGLESAVASSMSKEMDEFTVYRVQALLLYGIILHSCHQPQQAGSCISRAAKIAMELRMNEPSFARNQSGGLLVVEESLRRTWWELYTVDAYVATIHRSPSRETSKANALFPLPCDQTSYEVGHCDQQPYTLRQFENRIFSSDKPLQFSSYSYRIEAIGLVGRVLSLSVMENSSTDDVQALTNALAGWEYNLPDRHAEVIGPSGEVDLLLFQARCFVLCARLLLHFPRSELPPTIPSAREVACAKNYTQSASYSRDHTVKAIAASKAMTDLATAPWPLDRHSPFLVCGLVLACIVQLAAASIHFHDCVGDCLSQHRDRVILLLGALGRLGERWPLAHNAVVRLKVVAETIFVTSEEISDTPSVDSSFNDSAMDTNGDFIDMPWFELMSPEGIQALQNACG